MNMNLKDEAEKTRIYLNAHRPGQAAAINEYMAECEHQEGLEYWMDFTDGADLLADFDLYMEYSKEDQDD